MLDETIVSILEKRSTDIKDHLRTLYNLVVDHNFKVVVELGAGQSTYVLLAATLKTLGDFYSVDLLPIAHLREYSEGTGILNQHSCYHYIEKEDLELGKSWKIPIDFLLIDSDHEYKHVLDILRVWGPIVKKGGIITMHDTDHTSGHAARVKEALLFYLAENPELFSVEHITGCGGLSILTKLK